VSEWSDLRYFLAVARGGTLAAAARELRVEATTVGRRLVALEQSLGARLFDRTSDGFVLTLAGERILENARAIESQMADLVRRAAGEDERLDGTVRLATSENLAVGFLLRVLAPLHERHPGIHLEVSTGARAADLLAGEADLAVRAGPGMKPQQQSLVARKLASVGFRLYAAESYLERHGTPREGGGLAGHLVCTYGGELAQIPPATWLAELEQQQQPQPPDGGSARGEPGERSNGAQARVVLTANSMLGLTQSIAAGVGLGALPCFLGDAQPTLRRVFARPLGSADVWLVVHPDLQRVARVRAVIDFLIEAISLHAETLAGVS
jgi:DNA-binding transcriptional LysR family regulator